VIYVTGATGFIGSRIARRLIERGDKIRCLIRSRARGAKLEALGAEVIVGDVADVVLHKQGLHGASAAIHLAAIYEIGIVDVRAMQRTNVDGTRAFLAAVEQTHTPRIVYTSTTVALGPAAGEPSEPRDAYEGPYHSEYHRTKAAAHRLARSAQSNGVPVVIACPSFVYGPGDRGPAGAFIDDLIRRRLPALLSSPGWFSYVYVDDVADGIIAALDRGTAGEVYLLTGDDTSMNDFADRVTQLAGVKAPRLRLPVGLARRLGSILDPIARTTGLRFPITLEAVKTTAVDRWLHKRERATRDLAYAPRGLEAGLPDTVAWAKQNLKT
jgi:dihydroflavonol-4-reductase